MVSKFINDIKYFFERLFSKDGTPLLMLSIISVVLAVLEIIIYIIFIRGSAKLNIPFLLIYTYVLYFVYRILIRFIQFLLGRFNILHYHTDDYNYLESDLNSKIRKYNNSIYIKERDRYEATIVYVATLAIFMIIVLTFVINAEFIIKLVIFLVTIIPFFLFLKEPYEIITIDVPDQDLIDMTKKDFYETFLDKIFKEKQITSALDLPGEDTPEPDINYTEEQYYAQEQAYNNQVQQEQQQMQYAEPSPNMVTAPPPQNPNAQANPFNDINQEIDPNNIPKQWWQQ